MIKRQKFCPLLCEQARWARFHSRLSVAGCSFSVHLVTHAKMVCFCDSFWPNNFLFFKLSSSQPDSPKPVNYVDMCPMAMAELESTGNILVAVVMLVVSLIIESTLTNSKSPIVIGRILKQFLDFFSATLVISVKLV